MRRSIFNLKNNLTRTWSWSDPTQSDLTIERCVGQSLSSLKELQDSLSSLKELPDSLSSLKELQDSLSSLKELPDSLSSLKELQDSFSSLKELQDSLSSLKEVQDSLSSLPSLLASTQSLMKDTIQESQNSENLPQKSSSESCVSNKRQSKPWLLERESSDESCNSEPSRRSRRDLPRRSSRCQSIISAGQIEVGIGYLADPV